MSEPVTTIDPRFSDANAAATGWEEARRVLETAELFWIATVRPDGRPHITPLVAVWLDGAIHFCTGADEQKSLNLRGNPQMILMTGCNHWTGGLDVVVEGEAVQITNQDLLTRLAQAWTRKWDGRWRYQVRDGAFYHPNSDEPVHVFSVTPTKVFAHAKGNPFSQTRHQFSSI